MSKPRKTFRIESLENRQMMTGDVSASMSGGNLFINEAAAQIGKDNSVAIYQLANNIIRVEGLTNADGVKSLINGATYKDFTVSPTGNLNVNLGGGNDLVRVGFGDGSGAPSFNNVSIDTAAPPLVLSPSRTALVGPIATIATPDSDKVMLFSLNTKGSLSVNTGIDHDWVFMGQINTGTVPGTGNVTIRTGAGPDEVDFKYGHIHGNLDIQTYDSLSENDADVVFFDMDGTVDRDINVRMGGGTDSVYITDPNTQYVDWNGIKTNGSLLIDTGAGDDLINMRAFSVGDGSGLDTLGVNTGAGADTVIMKESHNVSPSSNYGVTGDVVVYTIVSSSETDIDSVTIDKVYAEGSLRVATGGGADQIQVTNAAFYDSIDLESGAGDDQVKVAQVVAIDNFMANLGDGNDTLNVNDLYIINGKASLLGGAGTDRITRANVNAGIIEQIDWEWINGRPQFPLSTAGITTVSKVS